MGPILVSINATFSKNQYQAKYPHGEMGSPPLQEILDPPLRNLHSHISGLCRYNEIGTLHSTASTLFIVVTV